MSRFANLPAAMTAFAEEVCWHVMGIAQVVLDVVIVATLALAVYTTGLETRVAGPAVLASGGEQVVAVHVPTVCVVGNLVLAGQDGACVTASVLQSTDS